MTDEIEHSRYETIALTKRGTAFINIYRTKGAVDWTLEIERVEKKRRKIITWPNSFLSDKAAQDAAKEKIIELGLLPRDFKTFKTTVGEIEDFMRKKGKRLERRLTYTKVRSLQPISVRLGTSS